MIKTRFIIIVMSMTIATAQTAESDIVTFTGSGNGPYTGSFGTGTVAATGSGSTLAASSGTVAPNPNSTQFLFGLEQILSATDVGDTGAVVDFSFAGMTFGAGDYFFVTSIGAEIAIVVQSRVSGADVDADWTIVEVLGPPPTFNDDGAGVNATIVGGAGAPAGLLLTASISGVDELRVSWTGNGSGHQGLQFGLVSIPEPSSFGLFGVGLIGLIILRIRSRPRVSDPLIAT